MSTTLLEINELCCKIISNNEYRRWRVTHTYTQNYHTNWIVIHINTDSTFLFSFWSVINKKNKRNKKNKKNKNRPFIIINESIATQDEALRVILKDKSFIIDPNYCFIDATLKYLIIFNKNESKFKIISILSLKKQFVKKKKSFTIGLKHKTHNISHIPSKRSTEKCQYRFANNANYFIFISTQKVRAFDAECFWNFDIYSCKKNSFCQQFTVYSNEIVSMRDLNRNIQISYDKENKTNVKSLTLLSQRNHICKYYVDVSNSYQLTRTDYKINPNNMYFSLSNKYLVKFASQRFGILNIETDVLKKVQAWKYIANVNTDDIMVFNWYNDNIFMFCNANYLFVFMNAVINPSNKLILSHWFNKLQYNEFMNDIIFKMIGFQHYGSWLISSKPFYNKCNNEQFPYHALINYEHRMPNKKSIEINGYFGGKNTFVVVTIFDRQWLEIVVDLDLKFSTKYGISTI